MVSEYYSSPTSYYTYDLGQNSLMFVSHGLDISRSHISARWILNLTRFSRNINQRRTHQRASVKDSRAERSIQLVTRQNEDQKQCGEIDNRKNVNR